MHFHAGTSETVAEIVWYGGAEFSPGQSGLAHLRLQQEIIVEAGERFIVRQLSPVTTIGGGVVLDPLARRPLAKDAGRAKYLEILRDGDHEAILAAMVERAPMGLRYEEVGAHHGWGEEEIRTTLKALTAAGRIRTLGDQNMAVLIENGRFESSRNKIFETVEQFQRQNPLLPGIAREDLRARAGRRVRAAVFGAALDDLVSQKRLETLGESGTTSGNRNHTPA